MGRWRTWLACGLGILLALPCAAAEHVGEAISWESWSDGLFERARREGRFVLLDLEAVWCHWCHVMDATTYRDPEVVSLIRARYVPVRVDQDSRPDLASRYEDYGWPATVVFDAAGREIVKLRGYLPPARMRSLLSAIVEDPSPGPSVTNTPEVRLSKNTALSEPLRRELRDLHVSRYDAKRGGWGVVHKYLDADSVEYSMMQARAGDAAAERMARQTLAAQLKLVDPVWGGVYQYSDGGVWENPHFEKIMSMQADNLRIYAQGYALWRDPTYLRAARDIHRYLRGFLKSPEGAFYTSQDADAVKGQHSASYFALSDVERRKRGLPRVDTHLYTRENSWVVHALVTLYGVTNEEGLLDEALTAAQWILDRRSLEGGGYRHGDADAAGPYLGDTAAAGRAFLASTRPLVTAPGLSARRKPRRSSRQSSGIRWPATRQLAPRVPWPRVHSATRTSSWPASRTCSSTTRARRRTEPWRATPPAISRRPKSRDASARPGCSWSTRSCQRTRRT